MPNIIEGPPEPGEPRSPLLKRLGWFAVIWIASVLAIAAISYGMRALILP